MAKVGLQDVASIGALICQRIPGRIAQHVRMNLEGHPGFDPGPLDRFCSPDTVNGAPRSETNMSATWPHRFRARNALISSPSSG